MAWDDTKVGGDDFTSSDYNAMVTDQKTRSIRTTGSGAPTSTPGNVGDFYIDTSASPKVLYVAMGTTSSADWKRVMSE